MLNLRYHSTNKGNRQINYTASNFEGKTFQYCIQENHDWTHLSHSLMRCSKDFAPAYPIRMDIVGSIEVPPVDGQDAVKFFN